MMGGSGNMLFSIFYGQHPMVTFGEPVGPSDNPPWAVLGKQNWR